MLTLKHGITNALIEMAHDRLSTHRCYADLVNKLGEGGVRSRLDKMQWVVGIYEGPTCVAGLWGNHEMHLVTRTGYEDKWVSPGLFRKFWRWYFDHHDKAVVTPDNGMVIPFLLRVGFMWDDNKLVLTRDALRGAH